MIYVLKSKIFHFLSNYKLNFFKIFSLILFENKIDIDIKEEVEIKPEISKLDENKGKMISII
jgi:hypothetical protein